MSDLIGEIHEVQRKRAVQRTVVFIVMAVLVAVGLFVAKVVWDRYRVKQAVAQSMEHLRLGTHAALDLAQEKSEDSADLRPDDDDTVVSLALIAAHRAWLLTPQEGSSAAIEEAASVNKAEAAAARGLWALANGDIPQAREQVDLAGEQVDAGLAPGHPQWLRGVLAQAQIYDGAAIVAGLEGAAEATKAHPEWADYHRTTIALRFHGAEVEQAFADLETARASFPGHLGFAADEAMYSAVLQRNLEGVSTVTDELLTGETALTALDRGRTLFARSVARWANANEDVHAPLVEAWTTVPAWDLVTRELMVEFALARTRPTTPDKPDQSANAHLAADPVKWLESLQVPPSGRALYDAWIELARGQWGQAVKHLGALDRDHPRVAYLTALALVEQRRWEEAKPWVERALRQHPGRVELDVALARIQSRDPATRDAAIEQLSEWTASDDRHIARLWTALGEAQLERARDSKGVGRRERRAARTAAVEAFDKALQRERMPAEAALQLAILRQDDRLDSAEEVQAVIVMYERAASMNPEVARYKLRLAQHLVQVGLLERAENALAELAARKGASAAAQLLLARLLTARHQASGTLEGQAEDAIESWIQKATSASANERGHALAHLDLARNTPESLQRAKTTLEALLAEDRADIEARVLHVETLLALGDREGAESSLELGQRYTPSRLRGRLYLLLAGLDARDGDEHRAARRAWSGWRKVEMEPRPARELLTAATQTSDLWLAIRQPGGAAKVVRALTDKVPHLGEAWVLRSRVELAGKQPEKACESARIAIERDDQLPAAHAALAACLAQSGDRAAAREAAAKAVELAKAQAKANAKAVAQRSEGAEAAEADREPENAPAP